MKEDVGISKTEEQDWNGTLATKLNTTIINIIMRESFTHKL